MLKVNTRTSKKDVKYVQTYKVKQQNDVNERSRFVFFFVTFERISQVLLQSTCNSKLNQVPTLLLTFPQLELHEIHPSLLYLKITLTFNLTSLYSFK